MTNTDTAANQLTQRMAALSEFSSRALQIPLAQRLQQAASLTVQLTGVAACDIFLKENDSNTIRLVAATGRHSAMTDVEPIPLNAQTGCGLALINNDTIITPDLHASDAPDLPAALERSDMQSAAHLPIQGPSEPLGVLSIYRHDTGPLPQDVLLCAGCVTTILSFAILYQQSNVNKAQHQSREPYFEQQLALLHDELDALTYAISHDLGAPVRAVQGFSRALEEDYADRLDDEGRHFLSRIQAAGDQIERMTQSLVHLARVSRSEIYPQRVDLSAMAREIRDTLHHTQPDRSVEWQIESGLAVYGDSHLLYNALEQLMRNAYQFTKDNKLARIRFYQVRRDGETVFIVRDNGIGFDPEQAKNLFKPFQRLHDNGCCGDGMGLALTARIIHRHGGRIWATGKPNAGAAFFFTVPSKDATIPTRDAAGWH